MPHAVRARFRAADLRVKKATAERERLRALIPEEQPSKRPRREEVRPYDKYDRDEFERLVARMKEKSRRSGRKYLTLLLMTSLKRPAACRTSFLGMKKRPSVEA